MGWRTAIDVIASTLPQCCSRIAGTAAWHIAIVERQLRSNASAYCSMVAVSNVAGRRSARVGHDDVDATQRIARGVDETRRTVGMREIRDDGDGVAAELRGRGVHGLSTTAADRDAYAFTSQRLRDTETQPLRSRGHRRPSSRDPEIHAGDSTATPRGFRSLVGECLLRASTDQR